MVIRDPVSSHIGPTFIKDRLCHKEKKQISYCLKSGELEKHTIVYHCDQLEFQEKLFVFH